MRLGVQILIFDAPGFRHLRDRTGGPLPTYSITHASVRSPESRVLSEPAPGYQAKVQ
jgi:hypothetical protein